MPTLNLDPYEVVLIHSEMERLIRERSTPDADRVFAEQIRNQCEAVLGIEMEAA